MGLDFADALGVDFCRREIWLERWAYRPFSPPTLGDDAVGISDANRV